MELVYILLAKNVKMNAMEMTANMLAKTFPMKKFVPKEISINTVTIQLIVRINFLVKLIKIKMVNANIKYKYLLTELNYSYIFNQTYL